MGCKSSKAAAAKGVTTTVTVYLPEHVQGKRVICSTQAAGSYRVDNSELQHSMPGLGYRKSMDIDDRSENPLPALWGSVVEGVLQDGWLKVEVQVQGPASDGVNTVATDAPENVGEAAAAEGDEGQEKAATRIQATIRGKTSRAETAVTAQNKKEAATKVQSIVRGNQARGSTATMKAGKEEADKGTSGDQVAQAGNVEVPKLDAAQVEDNQVPPFPGQARPANQNGGGGFFFCCSSATGDASIVETPRGSPAAP